MLCTSSSPRTSLHICRNNMVSDRPFPMLGRPLHDGRKVKLMRVGLSACRRERARSLHNGMEARVDIPVEALVKLSRPRPSPSRSAPYPLLWTHRRLRPATTPDRQARPPHRGTRWPSSSVSRCSLGSHLLTVRSISFTITPP